MDPLKINLSARPANYWEGIKMINTNKAHANSECTESAAGLIQTPASMSSMVVFGIASTGLTLVLAAIGLAAIVATPAQARCLIGGEIRQDIPDRYCLEAQRTGCVRALLTPDQYKSCLDENKKALASGRGCIIGGVVRNDLSALDCEEAKATGCVQRLLTPVQYRACLDAQPKR
jgi:hypothetical protein